MGVVHCIEISVVAAAVLGVAFFRIKQPALLAYIVAGLVLGVLAGPTLGNSVDVMEQVAHLGLVLLLFIVGLEMDLKGIFRLGARSAAAVLLQGPLTIGAVWMVFLFLHKRGLLPQQLGATPNAWFLFASAAGLSSTAVTVKLLADKYELTTQSGKVTVLTLIAQDIWAVLALSYASSLRSDASATHNPFVVALSALAAAAAMGILSRFILSRIVVSIGRSPELVTLAALGWCFLGSAAFTTVGLSAEMGALVAGITLGTLPTATDVLAKVSSLRDFFMALFFVALGISLPPPSLAVAGAATLLVGVVLVSRILLFSPLLLAARLGPQVAFTVGVNLAQISEFALLLVPVGIATHTLTQSQGSVISYAMMLSVLVSSYSIKYNDRIARGLSRLLPRRFEQRGTRVEVMQERNATPKILVLGYHYNARALLRRLTRERPDLISQMLVVDINLKHHAAIRSWGIDVVYGDISNPEILRHHGIETARVVLSTVADTYLRGTTNLRLLEMVLSLNPGVLFIGSASNADEQQNLLLKGAFGVVCPAESAAPEFDALLVRAGT